MPELPSIKQSQYRKRDEASQKPMLRKCTPWSPESGSGYPTEFGISTSILSHFLDVKSEHLGKPFELKIDNHRFVSYPRKVRNVKRDHTIVHFSIIFLIPFNAENYVAEAYQRLSFKLAFVYESLELANRYLTDQEQVISNDFEQRTDPYLHLTQDKRSLAGELKDVYDQLNDCVKRGVQPQLKKIYNEVLVVTFSLTAPSAAYLRQQPTVRNELDKLRSKIKSYHGIIPLCAIESYENDGFLEFCSPERSIRQIAEKSGHSKEMVTEFVIDLIVRKWAIPVYPLRANNVYTAATSPSDLHSVSERFKGYFGDVFDLYRCLARFNNPTVLKDFLDTEIAGLNRKKRKDVVVCMIRHQLLMQLHEVYYIMVPLTHVQLELQSVEDCPEKLQTRIDACSIDEEVKPFISAICAQLLETMTYQEVKKQLRVLITTAPLLDGQCHVDEVVARCNCSREELVDAFDKFSPIVVKFLRPSPIL